MKRFYLIFLIISGFSSILLAQYSGTGFYRLRNSVIADDCMRIYHDSINAQIIVGSASSVGDGSAAMERVGNYLNIDIKTSKKNETFTDPSSVIFLQQSSSSGNTYKCDVIGQGVGLKYISYCAYVGGIVGAQIVTGLPATITNLGNNLYSAHVDFNYKTVSQTRFLGDTNGNLTIHQVTDNSPSNAPDECKWYIDPINLTDNYFAAAPLEELNQNSKYYTSLRTAFSYKVPSSSAVTVYKVTAMPSEDGGLATLEKINTTQDEIIKAGLPVIIESTSLENIDNKLNPYYNASKAPVVISTASTQSSWGSISSSSVTVSGLTNSDVLYDNYGHHGHDVYTNSYHTSGKGAGLKPGWWPTGDNLGFFTSPYYDSKGKKWVYTFYNTQTIYKLGIKDGAVGFWEQVGKQDAVSGNEAYSYKPCQLFPVEKELGEIATSGAESIFYDVVDSDYLYGVRVVDGKLYAKDYGKYRNPSVKAGDAIDGMKRFYDYNEPYDQSNWVVLDVENPDNYVKHDLHVVGKLINRENPEIKVSSIESKTPSISSYEPNTYSPASFMGTQTSTVNGNTYFFVEPKPQEVVNIKWAVYGGNNKFYVEEPSSNANGPALKGGFVADDSFMDGSMSDFQVGQVYEFDAVVKKNTTTSNISLKNTPYTGGGVSNNYVVYPLEAGKVVTGTSKLLVEPKVTSVKYYNLMGVESDAPFKGVNIVVTSYDNGTRSTSKVIK